jgi:two-component system copper resistance phosphate regulon response regulator CusR
MKVLLVEDDVGIGRFVSQGLAQRGWHVHWERSAAAVVALVATGKFNLVILDLGLPDRDGLDICAEIRAAERGLPILMLTARAALDDRLQGFAAGADDYLSKPFAFDELAARVAVLLRRDRERQPDPLYYGKLAINPARASAIWDGRPVELDPRGFALLLALARAAGEVVSRSALITQIWGEEADISDNALDVCASALRRRLAMVTSQLTVQAVRGQGLSLQIGPDRENVST